jgi:hypothetical protein
MARSAEAMGGLIDRLREVWLPRVRRSLASSAEAMGGLVNRLRDFLWPHIRSALVWFSAVVAWLADRVHAFRRPQIRPALAWFSAVVAGLADRVHALRPAFRRPHEEPLETVSARRPNRLEALKWRVRMSRLGRSADGIIVLPLLGAVLVLGVFTATAATRASSSAGAGSDLTRAITTDVLNGEVVTQTRTYVATVTKPGKKELVTVERTRVRRRVVKRPGGVSTVLESVAVPGSSQTKTVAGPTKTVTVTGPTKTLTVTGPSETVTQVVTEVVTSEVTVTETVPKHPHP